MTHAINWTQKIITIEKSDMTLVQSVPSEIYELDTDGLHLVLRDLEDSEEGVIFKNTHNHIAEVSFGGITLASVVEIINGYTVELENGSYRVNLVGANNNVLDVLVYNNVQVASSNTAGLILHNTETITEVEVEVPRPGEVLDMNERLEADLLVVQSQLDAANTAMSNILESEVEEYDFNDGSGRQRAIQLKIKNLNETIENLTNRRERIYSKLNKTNKNSFVAYRR